MELPADNPFIYTYFTSLQKPNTPHTLTQERVQFTSSYLLFTFRILITIPNVAIDIEVNQAINQKGCDAKSKPLPEQLDYYKKLEINY